MAATFVLVPANFRFSGALVTRVVVRDPKIKWNLIVGDLNTKWNLVFGDTEMEWYLVDGNPQTEWNSILNKFI